MSTSPEPGYFRAYYLKNRETISANDKARRAQMTPEQRAAKSAYQKAYHASHPKPELTPERRAENNQRRRERYKNDPEYRLKTRAGVATAQAKHPRTRKAQRLRLYGLTVEEHEAMLTTQAGKCPICHRKQKLVVDHDHKTGAVRGLLCGPCNLAIGHLQDDPTILAVAIACLTKSSSGSTST